MLTVNKNIEHLLNLIIINLLLIFAISCKGALNKIDLTDQLVVTYSGDAVIEVGGPFIGVEFHHSSPAPQRISFYYPVANSIDLSTDYWHRDTSRILELGLKIGDGPKKRIGLNSFQIDLTPYSVRFNKRDSSNAINISYRFAKNKPAMIIRYEITNLQESESEVEFYTNLELSLRTSHTYSFKEKAWTEYDPVYSVIYVNYNDTELQNVQLFVANGKEQPLSFNTLSDRNELSKQSDSWWLESNCSLPEYLNPKEIPATPAAKYLYRKMLAPDETLDIVQIIGTCKRDEGRDNVEYLLNNYDEEIQLYEQSVINNIQNQGKFVIGNEVVDHSILWAKAILETNTHYLDGEFVPMPCPAEYNFYFTHDVLKTDLAAVNFDIERVQRDLNYIVRHANEEKIIPHAYYWKDSIYQTEYADHDNWNNFWFIIVSGSYLRHSNDIEFLKILYPYITKSLKQALLTKGDDDLMWSYRPDWWDIGNRYGPRSYMTILAIKAIKDYLFISSALEENLDKLPEYEELANRMHNELISKLWDDNSKYLINYYEPGKIDEHYYTGSLLAAHYELLDSIKLSELVNTAKEKLLDENVGIYNVVPMDFHLVGEYLKFSGNEAGDKYYYFNGGIWPHGNAWYALALMAAGQKDEALKFIKNVMTVKGAMTGPNGQPAMYEVRNANFSDSSVYGTVDKPQFMWAAAWYLYCLYHLYAIEENSWNICFDPYLDNNQQSSSFDLILNGKVANVIVTGKGDVIKHIKYGEEPYPSMIVPKDIPKSSAINIELGELEIPYLKSTNSILLNSNYKPGTLRFQVKAFVGHRNLTKVVSPYKPIVVKVNRKDDDSWSFNKINNNYEIEIRFNHSLIEEEIIVEFI
jgi:hypothetical protein